LDVDYSSVNQTGGDIVTFLRKLHFLLHISLLFFQWKQKLKNTFCVFLNKSLVLPKAVFI